MVLERVTGLVVDSTRAVSVGWAFGEGEMLAAVVATFGRAIGDSRRLGVLRGDCVTDGEFSAFGCRRATALGAGVVDGVGVGCVVLTSATARLTCESVDWRLTAVALAVT